MDVVKALAGFGHGDGRVLRCQHQVIQRALRAAELAVGGEGAGDVAGVAIELTARVDQHQITTFDRRRIRTVVQHAGIGARRHDGAVGRVLRAVFAEGAQQLGVQVVLAHILAGADHAGRALHGQNMGVGADGTSAAQDRRLVRVFEHAHLVQHAAQVAL